MMAFEFVDLFTDLTISIDACAINSKLHDSVNKRVDEIWQSENAIAGRRLFNGQVFNVLSRHGSHLTGEFIAYKYSLAQLRDKEIAQVLKINPLCISCVTRCKDLWLVGKRAHSLSQFPDCFEFAPSGSVDSHACAGDSVSYRTQVLLELHEETGIDPSAVKDMQVFTLAYDRSDAPHCEICVLVQLEESALALANYSKDEYQQLEWLDTLSLHALIQQDPHAFVPLSVLLFDKIQRLQQDISDE